MKEKKSCFEKSVKGSDSNLMESNVSLEKKLQFVFVIERDYVKS
jgi:hypothetical protein